MTNFEDLRSCFENEYDEDAINDVADWLMDFVYNEFNITISDAEVMDYLRGQCIQAEDEDMIDHDSMKRKYRNNGLHQKKARQIWEANNGRFYHPFGYYPVDKNGNPTDDESQIAYFKRYDTSSSRSKFLKRQSNKKIRRMNTEDTMRGGEYKKIFDYWWELY